MKISCQSCQAKYTIADEKVAGKTVKIKCKKCGMAIVVHGTEVQPAGYDPGPGPAAAADGDDAAETRVFGEQAGGSAPPPTDEWIVNVAEGDERNMTTAQLAAEYARGALSDDTYVWRDGMSDWLPIASVPELAQYAPPPAQPAEPEPGMGLMGTVMMDSASHAAASAAAPAPAGAPHPASTPPGAEAPRPVSAPPPAAAAAPAAARRAGSRAGVDLFGAAERADAATSGSPSAPPPGDRLIGERNENSVLFSLSALTATENAMAAPKKEEAALDLRPRPGAAPAKNGGRAGLDDIMSLGSGGLGAPMLAPPPLLAPVVEAPPPPAPVVAAPTMGAPVMPDFVPQKKSPIGLIIGGVAAVAVIVGVVLFATQTPDETTTNESTTESATPTATAAPTPSETAAAEAPTAEPSETAEPADTATAEAATTGGTRHNTGSAPAAAARTSKTAEKTPDKTPDKTPEEPPAAAKTAEKEPAVSSDKPFNRGAATSALGGAAASARSCKKPGGPTGSGRVRVTFAPSGNVTSAQVTGPPFAGTSVGGCVASVFRGAHVPPFKGGAVTVSKSFSIR